MARGTAEAFNIVCCLGRSGKLDDSPQNKKQKAATALLRDNYMSKTLPDQSLHMDPKFLDRSVGFALWKFCLT